MSTVSSVQQPTEREPRFQIGTAGWSIPQELKSHFPAQGSHLVRYSQTFNAVEINSSFYREHKPETYARWAQSTPEGFSFSAKLLRYFTQEKRLKETGEKLTETLQGMSSLGAKWKVLLVQLPPSLQFEFRTAERFFTDLKKRTAVSIAFEPRHLSWRESRALDMLKELQISKVHADPEPVPALSEEQSRLSESLLKYYRLHGSPEIYKSRYSLEFLESLTREMNAASSGKRSVWCIFDNTTFGHATANALEAMEMLASPAKSRDRDF